MLNSLYIENFAIIDQLEIKFGRGLNIITGETGAGKSIMLDALGLVLGNRADKSVLTHPDRKCVVEAHFDISKLDLESLFEQRELEHEPITIVRREISDSGRSRAFINDSPCRLEDLTALSEHLIEVHQQFDQLSIREEAFQRSVLDVLAAQVSRVNAFGTRFKGWKREEQKLNALKQNLSDILKQKDYLQFQLNELQEADLEEGEEDRLSDEQNLLTQASDIGAVLSQISFTLSEGENSIADTVRSLQQRLEGFNSNSKIASLQERLMSSVSEITDLASEASNIMDSIEHDPARLEEIEDRLKLIFNLRQKHGMDNSDDLLRIKEEIDIELNDLIADEHSIETLEIELSKLAKELSLEAEKISAARQRVISELSEKVVTKLRGLGMPEAQFQVAMDKKELDSSGVDKVSFLFSSNKGLAPSTIKLTASGGEISRLNLAIKSEVAGKLELPTMIFDEIDAGVSGEIARRIGRLLLELGQTHQVVCITHTPQIASLGEHHLHVSKESADDITKTRIDILNADARIEIIGQMLGGDPPGKEATDAARALLMAK